MNFEAWNHQTLAKFAEEANAKLIEQEELIKQLRADLRIVIDTYRRLVNEQARTSPACAATMGNKAQSTGMASRRA